MEKLYDEFSDIGNKINQHLESETIAIIDIVNTGGQYEVGDRQQGYLINRRPLITDNPDELFQRIYDWISTQYTGNLIYVYAHNFSGIYTYNFSIGDYVIVRLLGEGSRKDNHWIYERVQQDREKKNSPDMKQK